MHCNTYRFALPLSASAAEQHAQRTYRDILDELTRDVMNTPEKKRRDSIVLRVSEFYLAAEGLGKRTTVDVAIAQGEAAAILQANFPRLTFAAAIKYCQKNGHLPGVTVKSIQEKFRLAQCKRLHTDQLKLHVTLSGLYYLAGDKGTDEVINEVERRIRGWNDGTPHITLGMIKEISDRLHPVPSKRTARAHPPRLADLPEDAVPLVATSGRILRSVTKSEIRQMMDALANHVLQNDLEAIEMVRQFVKKPGILEKL